MKCGRKALQPPNERLVSLDIVRPLEVSQPRSAAQRPASRQIRLLLWIIGGALVAGALGIAAVKGVISNQTTNNPSPIEAMLKRPPAVSFAKPHVCSLSIPAGVSSGRLPKSNPPILAGRSGRLIQSLAFNSEGNEYVEWDANLGFERNRQYYCVTAADIELDIVYNGQHRLEKHTVAFSYVLGPDQSEDAIAKLNIKTNERSEDVVLYRWNIRDVYGFVSPNQ